MYPLLVFLHVASAFVFMLAHGATAAVMFRLPQERKPERVRPLLDVREFATMPFNISSGLMFLSGIVLGFMGEWWRAGWIWAALGGLVVIAFVMSFFGRMYFERIIEALDEAGNSKSDGEVVAVPTNGKLVQALASGRPMLLAVVGIGGFLAIVYLMMYKPF